MPEPKKEQETPDKDQYSQNDTGYQPKVLTPKDIEKMKTKADEIDRDLENDVEIPQGP